MSNADRSKAVITKAIPIAVSSLISVVFALAAWRFFISDPNDRYQCNALLNKGVWLNDGLTAPDILTNWQPDGCMLASYSPKTATQCLSGRRLAFAGDSTVRQLFYATAKLLDPGINIPDYYSNPPAVNTDNKKHQDVTLTIGGGKAGPASSTAITLEFVWDAFLNSSKVLDMLEGPAFGATKKPKPALFVLGTGLWQLRQLGERGMTEWSQSIDRVFAATQPGHIQIADEVILLPVQRVVTDKLNDQRRTTLTPQAIDRMNADLLRRLPAIPDRSTVGNHGIAGGVGQISIPYVFNDMISSASHPAAHTLDGIHFDSVFTKPMVTILMNLRCNDVLPKSFPFAKTCCNQYPAPNWLQGTLILLTLLSGPLLGQAVSGKTAAWLRSVAPSQQVCTAISIFGFGVIYQYFCDRTSLFMKVQKQFEFWPLTVAMFASLALGLLTLKKPEKDLGFLNRDQTDEWKGWMQVAILIYHYWGASKVSGIYNPIRVLVAAYLFMSGYGHFYFYYKKADFGLARIAAVLIRLNLLTLVLAYVQNTDYLSYYFSPLTTLWFIVIWLTMYVGHSYNTTNAPFLLAKIGISAAIMTVVHKLTWPLQSLFEVFNAVFATQWNAREWSFRVTLDMWIVYIGMLAAYAVIVFNDYKLWDRPSWPIVRRYGTILAAMAMIGYMAFELHFDKFAYNIYHPYISVAPVLAFTILRNATPLLRSTSSKAYIWIGQCSLETFICQFHIWLGGDTKGILMLLPFPRWRTLNMVVSTIIFLFVSHHIARATGEITDSIGGKAPRPSVTKRPSVVPATAGNGDAASGNYIALAVVEPAMKNGSNGEVKLNAHSRQPSASQAPLGSIAKILNQLPVRIALILLSLWVLNLLYPTGHLNEGHLLPLSH